MLGSSRTYVSVVALSLALFTGGTALAEGQISFGPRAWFLVDNSLPTSIANLQIAIGDEADGLPDISSNNNDNFDQGTFVLVGGSVLFPLESINADLIVTGYRGGTDVDVRQRASGAVQMEMGGTTTTEQISTVYTGTAEFTRTDIDVLLRRTVSTGDRVIVSGIVGVRYERNVNEQTQIGTTTFSFVEDVPGGGDTVAGATGTARVRSESALEYFNVRGGASVFAPVNDRHGFYVDAQGLFGYSPRVEIDSTQTITWGEAGDLGDLGTSTSSATQEIEPVWFVGPDITVGYRWNIIDRVGFESRYRTQIQYPLTGDGSVFDNPRVSHGLSLGLTFNL